jgi:cysteine synthase
MAQEMELSGSIIDRIGNTSIVRLRDVVPRGGAKVLLKMEGENPTGSMKDRMALAMVEAAEGNGRLGPRGHVVEYTGGSTGLSLALVCAVKRHRLSIVTSDAFSMEKRSHMKGFGASLTVIPSEKGGMNEKLTREMIETAREIQAREGGFWTNQLYNADQLTSYRVMGEEIWRQTAGRVDAFVQSVGTAASLRGTAEALKDRNPGIRIVAVEPSESAVLSGAATGVHRIEGVGAGFVVPLWEPSVVDEIQMVSTEEAMDMARALAGTEGIFAGTSTGANLVVALRIARTLGADATVVTVMCDTGMKYLSTGQYGDVSTW